MASQFNFGFAGDDIDIDEEADSLGHVDVASDAQQSGDVGSGGNGDGDGSVPPRLHTVEDLLSTLPSKIAYSHITIPTSSPKHGAITIPRRELFDVRLQLMAEDHSPHSNGPASSKTHLLDAIESDDLRSNIYEGGLKSWECSLDLVRVLAEDEEFLQSTLEGQDEDVHVVELGAGTALPSIALFKQCLGSRTRQTSSPSPAKLPPIAFTVADYNIDVLRLVTIPNFLLTWALSRTSTTISTDTDMSSPPAFQAGAPEVPETGDLDITPALITSFLQDLETLSVTIRAISGAWSPEFSYLLSSMSHPPASVGGSPSTAPARYRNTLILASETIYAPQTLAPFTEVLLSALRRDHLSSDTHAPATTQRGTEHERTTKALALIAVKRIYFGVGGGVDEFVRGFLTEAGAGAKQQSLPDGHVNEERGVVKEVRSLGGGVSRVVLELRLASERPESSSP